MASKQDNFNEILDTLEKGIFERELLNAALFFEGTPQQALHLLARKRRGESLYGDVVEVRSVIEVSNQCRQGCRYCNMGKDKSIPLYSMDEMTMIRLMDYLHRKGRKFILIQSGENNDPKFVDEVCRAIQAIKSQYPDVVITLCLGDLDFRQYLQLKKSGAERYILKFETSNPRLFRNAKPNDTLANRLRCLESLLDVGFAVGSGIIVGLPGQRSADLVQDLLLIHRYNLTMNSATVFIPAENSEYRDEPHGDIETTLNFMALMRIMNPNRLMPTTSSTEKIQKGGQLRGLMAGANTVTVHDGTPEDLKSLFPIYSNKRVLPQEDHFKAIVAKAHMSLPPEVRYAP